VVTADVNGDGWIDIYVANDGKENQLWMNRRNGTFENTALRSGVALPVTARAEASMGVDAGDVDDDGDEDVIVTELTGEGSNFYVNDGSGVFEDRSAPSSLGPLSVPYTGFGAAWLDFDNDGRLDLLTVNGAVQTIERQRQAKDPLPLRQRTHALGLGQLANLFRVFTGQACGRRELDGARRARADERRGHADQLCDALARFLLQLDQRHEAARGLGHHLARFSGHHRAGERRVGSRGVDQRPHADVAVHLAVPRRQVGGVQIFRAQRAGRGQPADGSQKSAPL
jgi:hypothetical protein